MRFKDYRKQKSAPTRTIKALAPVDCPEHPFARILVLLMSMAVFALLVCILNFVFREVYIDVFITQTPLDAIVKRHEYVDIWAVGLRFDAQFAYYMMLPGVLVCLFGFLGPAFFRLCLKILGTWFTLCAFYLTVTTIANIHTLGVTGMPLSAAQVDAFMLSPFSHLLAYGVTFPIFFDFLITVVVCGLFLGLWHRITTIFSTSTIWKNENWINWLLCLTCFFGLMWTSVQSPITTSDPLTPKHALISDIPMVNFLVMNAPMSIFYSDSHEMLAQINQSKTDN